MSFLRLLNGGLLRADRVVLIGYQGARVVVHVEGGSAEGYILSAAYSNVDEVAIVVAEALAEQTAEVCCPECDAFAAAKIPSAVAAEVLTLSEPTG